MDLAQIGLAALIVALPLLVLFLLLYLLRKGRISMTTTFGSMYEAFPRGQQEAIQVLVEKEAHKKMEEDETGAPGNPTEERFHEQAEETAGEGSQ